MSGPAPLPSARAHDQHDPLLVAQVTAGDRLDAARMQEAEAWLRTCPACAALATDLRHVSAAVAGEPVPPRRRDFRLTVDQADRLQGNVVTRFLRRLSAPRARALGPAAAGALSLGLVFVVAGYALPDDGAVSLVSDTNVAPAPIEERAEGTLAPVLELAPIVGSSPLPGTAVDAAADDIEAFAADPEFLEELDEHQAGMSARSKAATTSEAELADDLQAPADAVPEVPEAGAPAADDQQLALADPPGSPSPARAGGEVGAAAADDDQEQWLIVFGVALVLGGGGVLVLVWLGRRQRDPLLR